MQASPAPSVPVWAVAIFLRSHGRRLLSQHAIFLGAAITGVSGKVRYNFGEVPFVHAPPDEGYEAFCVAAAQ